MYIRDNDDRPAFATELDSGSTAVLVFTYFDVRRRLREEEQQGNRSKGLKLLANTVFVATYVLLSSSSDMMYLRYSLFAAM